MNKLKCQACFTFFSITIGAMLSHLIKVHRNDPNLNITCEVPGCQLTFAKLNSYKSHLHRKHSNIDLKRPLYVEQENELSEFEEEESMDVEDTDHDCDINQDEFLYDELKDRIEADKKMNALYLLKTKECNLLTQKATDDIVEGSTWLVRNTVEMLQQGLQDRLDSAGIDFRAVPGLSELFSEGHPISNPFKYVSTKHKQGNYFKEAFGLVTPRRITLGHSSKKQRVGKQYREVLKEEEMIYIPLLDTLQQMLNQESILNEVQTSHKRNDAMIADFCDGNIFSTHPLFSRDPTALQLMLYYDEVEISNPLGTKTGKHKLGVVYFTLGNIDPKHRSQTNAIQLLAIATTPIIKKYGIDNLLEPFMEDLEKLEQDGGHQFSIKGVPMSFAGSIAFVSGDNLGSQLIGGFKEGSGAFLKCRHCMGNKDDIKTKFCERDFILRTSAGHDQQCQNIERNPDLSKTYGVCRMSVLCNSRYFHVVNGLPGDAMHDILEGILQYQCKEMLNMFIYEDKYFTLDQLNLRLKKFDYGHYNDKNKPSPITAKTLRSDNNSLKQKAAQMWCLGKHLPLIIGSCVPEDDEKWQHFLTLLEIVDLVFAPVTSVNSLGVLEGLIEEYLWQFSILYPGRSIIPKMHYLVHYPTHMYNFGPMVNTWCMRYEAKHRYFKKIAMNMGNFTNVAFTLAERHQLQSSYVMSASKEDQESRFLYKPTTIGHGKQEVVGDTQYFQALKQHQRMIDETDHVYEAKKVTICGTEYRIGSVVFEGLQNRLPRFASVEKIVVLSNDNIWFILKRFLTIKFSQHFHAFQIQRPINADCVLMRQTDFGTYLPAHVTRPLGSVNERSYVAPRYNVPQQ